MLEYIAAHKLEIGKDAIDLGCGIGRNSLYLAERGYSVVAVDFAESALDKFCQILNNNPQSSRITIRQLDLTKELPFADNSFDLATDIVTTMTLTPDELPGFEYELRRVVRPNGLFLTYVLSCDDGFLEAMAPGGTTTTVEKSGITDNYLSEDQLRNLYKEWEVLKIDKIEKIDHFYGKNYARRIWWMLLKNNKQNTAQAQ